MNSTMMSHGWVCSVVFIILLSLSGTNVQAGSSASTVPSSLSFGSLNVNSFSSPQGFTVMNTGTQKLTIGSVVSSSSQFAVSGPALPVVLPAGRAPHSWLCLVQLPAEPFQPPSTSSSSDLPAV